MTLIHYRTTVLPLLVVLVLWVFAAVAYAQDTPTPTPEEEPVVTATPTAAAATSPLRVPEATPLTEMDGCGDLPTYEEVTAVLDDVVAAGESGGFGNEMWATLVDRDGIVCVITYSGSERGEQWPGSRIIATQKANTVNAFGLPDLALSTANLYAGTQPGGSLYGLLDSLPVYPAIAYVGPAENYGTIDDPMIGLRMGGISVFGGGLALYDADGTLVGGLGLSGDTSCTDHIIAWKVRDGLALDYVPAGVTEANDDNIVFDIRVNEAGIETSASGWGHPACGLGEVEIAAELPEAYPLGNATASYPNSQLLVDAAWLSERLDDANLRIIDMRAPDAYAAGHVPGAVNIPVAAIVATVNDIPFEFDRTPVQDALNAAGLTPEMTAVIYDNLGMMNAARLFWTLEYVGHADVRIMNGGWNAWVDGNYSTSIETPEVERTDYPIVTNSDKLVTAEQVLERLADPGVVIVDARSPHEYTGAVELAARGGHIPGAVNLVWLDALTGGDVTNTINADWQEQLQDTDVEVFKDAGSLQALLDELGIREEQTVITYCQTLWRGAHTYFLLRLMGFNDVRGYDGSWAEWGNRTDLPVVAGDEPGSLSTMYVFQT